MSCHITPGTVGLKLPLHEEPRDRERGPPALWSGLSALLQSGKSSEMESLLRHPPVRWVGRGLLSILNLLSALSVLTLHAAATASSPPAWPGRRGHLLTIPGYSTATMRAPPSCRSSARGPLPPCLPGRLPLVPGPLLPGPLLPCPLFTGPPFICSLFIGSLFPVSLLAGRLLLFLILGCHASCSSTLCLSSLFCFFSRLIEAFFLSGRHPSSRTRESWMTSPSATS